jgi:anti-sigma factor RsiW
MAACPTIQELEAFFDGELSAARSAEIRAHLLSCSSCSAELAGLEAAAQLFRDAPMPRLSQISLHRLHAKLETVMQGEQENELGILRIARTLSAIAACIVVAGSLWLSHVRSAHHPNQTVATVQTPPPWTDVAVNTDTDAPAVSSQDGGTVIAEYYLADASQRTDEQP